MRRISNNETPEERFKRVAEARTSAVLDKLRLLGNCSNRQIYGYSEEDINKIFSAITKRVRETKSKFHFSNKEGFKL
ncbi:MAG: hypothetical protein MUO17_00840 [Dehalococcoidales bacterium]|nr:hypothetical protein [Dehalococcoidales bacterium]